MKTVLLSLLSLAVLLPAAPAASLIFADNFNAPDAASFDASSQDGRRSGALATDVQLRSSLFQHAIVSNQLQMGAGRVRIHNSADLNTWHDFATGPAGASILGEQGLRVEFDWTPVNNTDTNWVSVDMGIAGQSVAEPGTRVNHPDTDFGILFRHNGGVQYFDNGAPTDGAVSFLASTTPRHVVVDYTFSSFADGTNVGVTARVDGSAPLLNRTFQWAGNNGSLYMELGTNAGGTRIDNLSITAVPEPSALVCTLLAGSLALNRRRRC